MKDAYRLTIGQGCSVLIRGINVLLGLDVGNLSPSGIEAMGSGGEVGFNERVQFFQIIARHGGKHVVLDVKIHVPVEELDKAIEREGTAAEAEIADLILQADVLGIIAKEL